MNIMVKSVILFMRCVLVRLRIRYINNRIRLAMASAPAMKYYVM